MEATVEVVKVELTPRQKKDVENLTQRRSPVEDKRLEHRNGTKAIRYKNLLAYGESGSWTMGWDETTPLPQEWNTLAEECRQLLGQPEKLQQWLEGVNRELDIKIARALELYEEQVSPGFMRLLGPSGGEAMAELRHLIGDARPVTTDENGSEWIKDVNKAQGTVIALRDENGSLKGEEALVKEYCDAIDNGAKFVSITLVSKTGIRYDQVVEQVAAHAQGKAFVLVDAVQMNGRGKQEETWKWLGVKGVHAVVTTGSKAFGAVPHAGVITLNAEGQALLKETRKHGDWLGKDPGVAAKMRMIDNLEKMAQGIRGEKEGVCLCGKEVQEAHDVLLQRLVNVGFRKLPEDEGESGYKRTESIVAFGLPEGKDAVWAEEMIKILRSRGIELCGPIMPPKDEKGNYLPGKVILRWAISRELVEQAHKRGGTVGHFIDTQFTQLVPDIIAATHQELNHLAPQLS